MTSSSRPMGRTRSAPPSPGHGLLLVRDEGLRRQVRGIGGRLARARRSPSSTPSRRQPRTGRSGREHPAFGAPGQESQGRLHWRRGSRRAVPSRGLARETSRRVHHVGERREIIDRSIRPRLSPRRHPRCARLRRRGWPHPGSHRVARRRRGGREPRGPWRPRAPRR